jgi:filamentous hemagglutinin family protein
MKHATSRLNPIILAASLLLASRAYAVGTGTIADGVGSIGKQGNSTTTVTQSSDKLVVDWNNMDVAARETLNFVQPSAASAVLNRVSSADPTAILGTLNANGRVFVVNPNGVLIGNGAKIDVGSLIASSLHLADEDFKAGKLRFVGGGTGDVLNRGKISAAESVGLIGAKKVANTGSIKVANGNVVLAAGDDISLSFSGGNLQATLSQGSLNALVDNGGLIATANGDIVLTAWARDALARSVVNNTGVLEATQLKNAGSIELASLGSGEVDVGGSLRTRGSSGILGAIEFRGRGINIGDGAKLDAVRKTGLIRLFATPDDHAAGYVTFGKAKLAADSLEIETDNILTSADSGTLPSFDTTVSLRATTGNRGFTLGRRLSADESSRLHDGRGAVSADFVKAASRRGLSVDAEGAGDIVAQGTLKVGALELNAVQGRVHLNGEISGRALRVTGSDVALSGKTRTGALNVAADTLALDGDVTATSLILHANERAASDSGSLRAKRAQLSGGRFDLTRGGATLDELELNVESADLVFNGNATVRAAFVEGDLRLRGLKNLRLDEVTTGGNLDASAEGNVSIGDLDIGGETDIVGKKVIRDIAD